MITTKDRKYFSVSDLADEFQVTKSSLELYGVHRLLPPLSGRPNYRSLDKVRLQFIQRAKNADYSIGNIKNLIGILDFDKEESDQIEESLVYCKKKNEELKQSLEGLDVLEQINITCDLELLEGHITDLTNLKYSLKDFVSLSISTPYAKVETKRSKPDIALPNIRIDKHFVAERKALWGPLLLGFGVLLIAVSAVFYFKGNSIFGTKEIKQVALEMETVASNPPTSIAMEKEKTNLVKPLGSDLNSPGETIEQVDDVPSTAGFPISTPQELQKTKTETNVPENEDTEDAFIQQLVADLQNKYDERASNKVSPAVDPNEELSNPNKEDEIKETKSAVAVTAPKVSFQKDETSIDQTTQPSEIKKTSEKKILNKPENKKPVPEKKVSLKAATATAPKKAVPPVAALTAPSITVERSNTDSGAKSSSVESETPADKIKTSALPKEDELANKTAPSSKPQPKQPPPTPTNPEALKWVQKSYESVMRGDAGEAIITASVAITLDSRSVNAYINRSWAYSKKGLYDKAIKDCDKALDIDGENALAYNNRGLAFQGKGDLDRAKADYERACKLGFDIGCNNYQEVVNALASDS